MSVEDQIIQYLRNREENYLGSVHGYFNPFARSGATASEIAWEMQWLKGGTTKAGRLKVDIGRAKRILNAMVRSGLIECPGSQRTLQAGSRSVHIYTTLGFSGRLQIFLKQKGLIR